MPDDQLTFVLAAKDNASATLNRVSREVRGLGPAAGSAAGPLGVLGTATGGLVSPATLAVGAFAALATGAVAAIDLASDKAENLSKVKVVFGELSDEVEHFADSAAENLGLSESAALGFMGTFGNLFTAMEIGVEESQKMSEGILQLGADLGSFNNIPVADALDKLRAGLVGETEPLRALGVNLTAAGVAARAVEMGLAATTTEVSAAAKAQAAYSLIMEQTTSAQGDYARTADGLANTQRTIGAQFEDIATDIGTKLAPALLGAATFVKNDLVPALEQLITLTETLGPVFERLWVQANPGPEMADTLIAMDRAAHGGSSSFDTLAFSARKTAEAFLRVGGVLADGAPEVEAGAETLFDPVAVAAEKAKQAAIEAARALTGAYAEELASGADAVEQAWEDLLSGAENEQTKAQRIADINAKLTSETLREHLASEDPYLRLKAIETREILETELATLTTNALYQAWLTGQAVPDALEGSQRDATTAAANYAKGVKDNLIIDAYPGGVDIGTDWIDGVVAGIASRMWLVTQKANELAAITGTSLPTAGPLQHPRKGGLSIGEDWVKGIGDGIKGAGLLDGFRMPGMTNGNYAMAGAGGGSRMAGLTLHVSFNTMYPPTPSQAQEAAKSIFPEFMRLMRRNGVN